MLIAIAASLAFLSVFLVMLGLRNRAPDPVQLRLHSVQAGLRARQSTTDRPFSIRVVSPTASSLGKLLAAFLPTTWIKASAQRLVWAGSPMSIDTFVVFSVLAFIAFPFLAYFWSGNLGLSGFLKIVALVIGLGLGAYAPQFWLKSRVGKRQYEARRSLPDALDLLVTSVEAGLSLDAAMMRVAERESGPFHQEMARALQDMSLGRSRRQALTEMAQRLNVAELTSFIQTLNQAELTGAPIGQILRVQAEQVRISRRQAAEAQAQKAPLLMRIPLILFILPSLFIVLLAPAAFVIGEALGGDGPFG